MLTLNHVSDVSCKVCYLPTKTTLFVFYLLLFQMNKIKIKLTFSGHCLYYVQHVKSLIKNSHYSILTIGDVYILHCNPPLSVYHTCRVTPSPTPHRLSQKPHLSLLPPPLALSTQNTDSTQPPGISPTVRLLSEYAHS